MVLNIGLREVAADGRSSRGLLVMYASFIIGLSLVCLAKSSSGSNDFGLGSSHPNL